MKLLRLEAIPVPVIGTAELQKEKMELTISKMRIKTLTVLLACLLLIGLGVFASSAMAANAGSFPILLDRSQIEAANISLSEDPGFNEPTVHLDAPVSSGFSNISGADIPAGVDGDHCGSHNGPNYIAYTYYLRNDSDTDCNITEKINILDSVKGADSAVRIRVYRNGVETTYAKRGTDGLPEVGTVPFSGLKSVLEESSSLPAGALRKYTIVIWLEGDDPDCTDSIKGGSVKFSMEFAASK